MPRLAKVCQEGVDGRAVFGIVKPRVRAGTSVLSISLAVLVGFSACGAHEPAPEARPPAKTTVPYSILSVRPIRFPFAGETLAPYVARDGSGGFLVSWMEKRTPNLNYAALRGGKWLQSRTITGGKLAVKRVNFPSMTAVASVAVFSQR